MTVLDRIIGCRVRAAWVALGVGLVLRLVIVYARPGEAGDSPEYTELAENLLDHGVLGQKIGHAVTPLAMRVPGYPLFLALCYAAFGGDGHGALVVQAVLDAFTVLFAAGLAARLARLHDRERVATVALWLAALCPFTASYTRYILTESLATFLTTLAALLIVRAIQQFDESPLQRGLLRWFVAGIAAGVGSLVRPEGPLLVIAAVPVVVWQCRARLNWMRLIQIAAVVGVGCALPLVPWVARNASTFGRFQVIGAWYANAPGATDPGLRSWTKTWLTESRSAWVLWNVDADKQVTLAEIPEQAFDSDEERTRVEKLFAQYNAQRTLTPAIDAQFRALACERMKRRPFKHFVTNNLRRVASLWLSPQYEFGSAMLKYASRFVTLAYIVLFGFGCWCAPRRPELAFLGLLLLVRTALLTQTETVEPRYMVVTLPIVLAIAAQGFRPRRSVSLEQSGS